MNDLSIKFSRADIQTEQFCNNVTTVSCASVCWVQLTFFNKPITAEIFIRPAYYVVLLRHSFCGVFEWTSSDLLGLLERTLKISLTVTLFDRNNRKCAKTKVLK